MMVLHVVYLSRLACTCTSSVREAPCRVMLCLSKLFLVYTLDFMQERMSLLTQVKTGERPAECHHSMLLCWSKSPCNMRHQNICCSNRFVFVNLDACMASQAVTLGVMERLKVCKALLSCCELSAVLYTVLHCCQNCTQVVTLQQGSRRSEQLHISCMFAHLMTNLKLLQGCSLH